MDVSKTFYTSRLLIRPIEDDDITFVHRALSNPIIYNFLTIRYDTLEATKEQMEWYKHLSESGKGFWWAICDKNTKSIKKQKAGTGFYQNIGEKDTLLRLLIQLANTLIKT